MRYRNPQTGQFITESEAKKLIADGAVDQILEDLEDYSDEESDDGNSVESDVVNSGNSTTANPAENRKDYIATGIFGAPRSGKSSLTLEWMIDYDSRGGKVIALDRAKQFGKFSVWPGYPHLDDWLMNEILGKFHGLLVLDDCDLYLDANANANWKDVIVSFRHWGLDICASSRRPQDIPTRLLSCLEHAALFRTAEPRAIKKIGDWVGDDIAAQIPKVPYEYLMVDVFARVAKIEHTKAMGVQTIATGKNLR